MNKTTYTAPLLTLALSIMCCLGMNQTLTAQCQQKFSFENTSDIPTACDIAWNDGDFNFTVVSASSGSCAVGACAFSTTDNGAQNDFLNISDGTLEIVSDFSQLSTLVFQNLNLPGTSSQCAVLKLMNGNTVAFEQALTPGYYNSPADLSFSYIFDKIVIEAHNRRFYNFTLNYYCEDGAPAFTPVIDFEEFQQGQFFGNTTPGQPWFTSEGVDVYYADANGNIIPPSMAFIWSPVETLFGHGFNNFFANGNILLDFTSLNNPVNLVYFDNQFSSTNQSIAVNGGAVWTGTFPTAPMDIFPGYTFTNFGQIGDTQGQRYALAGNIETLLIGADEFFVDNISFAFGAAAVCEINDLSIAESECNSADNTIDASIYLTVTDAPADFFEVHVDGEFFQNYNLNPNNIYELTGLPIGENSQSEITVCFTGTNCCSSTTLLTPDCANQNCLSFVDNEEYTFYSSGTGTLPGDPLELINPQGVSASMEEYFNADSIAFFQSMTFWPTSGIGPESMNLAFDFTNVNGEVHGISFTNGGGCCLSVNFNGVYYYFNDLADFTANAPTGIEVTVATAGGINSVYVQSMDPLTTFSIGNINGQFQDFCYYIEEPTCEMDGLTFETGPCDPNNQFELSVDFDHTGNTDSFNIIVGLTNENFAYDDLPVSIFLDAISGDYDVLIQDLLDVDCSLSGIVEEVDCSASGCEISNLAVVSAQSINGVLWQLQINTQSTNPTGDNIDFYINGEYYTSSVVVSDPDYNYFFGDQFPTLVDQINTLTVCVQDNPNCCSTIDFEFTNQICEFSEVTVTDTYCENSNEFYAVLDFEWGPFSTGTVGVNIDGEWQGYYFDVPLTVGPMASGSSHIVELLDSEWAVGDWGCSTEVIIDSPLCQNDICSISNLEILGAECFNGELAVAFGFEVENPGNDFYEAWLNGVYAGVHSLNLSNNTYLLDELTSVLPNQVNELQVCINDNPNCCQTIEFEQVCVDFPICELTDLSWDFGPCDPNDQFELIIDLNHTGSTDSFNVQLWNQTVDQNFAYADLPVSVFVQAHPGATNLFIQDVTDASCAIQGYIGNMDCPTSTCDITTLGGTIGPCVGDGTFFVDLNVQNIGVGTTYELTGNGQNYGIFEYDTPVTVGPFVGDGNTTIYSLVATDTEYENCSHSHGFNGPICQAGVCDITNFDLDAFECSGDGLVDLDFSMSAISTGNDFFEAFINDVSLGLFPFNADNTYSIQGIQVNNNIQNIFSVCVNDQADCCDQFSFVPYCDPSGCTINNFNLEYAFCEDGVLDLGYFFFYNNGSTPEYFEAWLNGNSLGEFLYTANLYFITDTDFHIPNAVNELQVCLVDQPDCCETLSFFVDCPDVPVCELTNPEILFVPCDPNGNFEVFLDFDYSDVSPLGFSVIGNGQNYGNFQYESLPVKIGPFDSGVDIVWELLISDADNPDCTLATEFPGVACDPSCGFDVSLANVTCLPQDTVYTFAMEIIDFPIYTTLNGQTTGPIFISSANVFSLVGQTIIPNQDNIVTICVSELNCCQDVVFDPSCTTASCELLNPNVELLSCSADGNFNVLLDFAYANGSPNGFSVTGTNGQDYGNFQYESLPIEIGPFDSDADLVWELIISDADNADCTLVTEFSGQDCIVTCELFGLEIFGADCVDGALPVIDYIFESNNSNNDFHEVWLNNVYQGIFPLDANNSYTLEDLSPVYDQQVNIFRVCINDQPDCCQEVEFTPTCSTTGACDVNFAEVQSVECLAPDLANIFIYVTLDVPGNAFFDLYLNGEFFSENVVNSTDQYNLLEANVISGQENTITVCVNSDPNCCTDFTFTPDCTTAVCDIDVMVVEPLDCTPNGIFYVDFDFTHEGPGSSFTLTGNGENYGTFDYADLPIQVGPFNGIAGTTYELIATDSENPDCGSFVDFESIDCSATICEISNFEYLAGECIDGALDIFFSFDAVSPFNDFFEAWLNNEYLGIYPIESDGSYVIEAITTAIPGQLNELQICINDNPDCCQTIVFEPTCLNNPPCAITAVTTELLPCTANDIFFVQLNFDYNDFNSGQFYVAGNGENYGSFDYTDLPVTIGPFESGLDLVWELIVTDNQFTSCTAEVVFQGQECSINNCEISNANVSLIECDDLNEFYAILDFDYVNPSSDSFIVVGNGENYGTFHYTELPVTVGPFDGNLDPIWELIAFDAQDEFCSDEVSFSGPGCSGTDCEISELTVALLPCNDQGEYYVDLDFDYTDNNSGIFEVSISGNIFESYSYADLPIQVGPFESGADLVWNIDIVDSEDEDCSTSIDFQGQDCPINDCMISDAIVELLPCNDQGQFYVELDFDYTNNNSGIFEVSISGNIFESYSYADLPIQVGPFESGADLVWNLDIVDSEDEDCSISIDFDGQDCPINDCWIADATVELLPCNDQNEFYITLDFEHNDINSGTFVVTGNGENYGSFLYENLPVNIGPFESGADLSWELIITDTEIPECSTELGFDGQDCVITGNCEIGTLSAEIVDCDNEQYYVLLNFDYTETSDYFIVGGTLTGIDPILYTELPLLLGPYDASESATIEVIDAEDASCFNWVELAADPCGTSCNIDDLTIEQLGCSTDGTYGFAINFVHDFPAEEEFQIYLDGELLGNFTYGSLPITTNGLTPSDLAEGSIEIVTALDNCTLEGTFEMPDCSIGDCFTFNNLDAGLNYSSGDGPDLPHVLFTQEGVPVSLNDCGPTDFYEFAVVASPDCEVVSMGNNAIGLQGASLNYDFSVWDTYPTSLTFAYCGSTTINIGGQEFELDIANTGPVDMGNGYAYTLSTFPAVGNPIQVIIQGPGIGELSICGNGIYGPVCFDTGNPPDPTDGCYGFENFADGDFYTSSTAPTNFYASDFLTVSPSDEILEFDFMGITTDPTSPTFNGAIGNYAVLDGTLLFDFTATSAPTEFITFDFAGDNLLVKVNDGTVISFQGLNTTDSLLLADNGVVLFFHREASNPVEGTVSLFGAVEKLWIASDEISVDNICYYFEIQQAEIWPGDIDSDNEANNIDLLYLGIANGSEGPGRSNAISDWQGQTGIDWEEIFITTGVNYKHADANGDGVVDEADYQVLLQNLGNVHGPVEDFSWPQGDADDPPIFVDLSANGPLTAGQPFNVPINLGTLTNPATGVHGVAFSLRFDPEDIDPNSVDIVLNPSSWMGEDLWIVKRVLPEGIIEVAISRHDQDNSNGFGGIAYFIGIIDDLVGKEIDTEIFNTRAIGGDEDDVPLYAQNSSGSVTTSSEQQGINAGLHVFPNPANQTIHVRNYNQQDLKRISIHNALGQQVYLNANPMQRNELDVSRLGSGVYFIQLYFAYEWYTYKIDVIH